MRVKWQEVHEPYHAEDFKDYVPTPPTKYAGEVIGVVRTWVQTMLVVMLDTGKVTEVAIEKVEKA